MVYIFEIKRFHSKLYTEIFEDLYDMMNDPEHESGLYNLPENIKDLVMISKLEYEFASDEEETDHQKYRYAN